ncbi:MAG: NADPH:quinone oxidoreductase family protein [Acidimicrobiales bacterium]|nr:NADPH:quinone oxidoreductase family protein [Acidimicrobiales bacterium]MDG2219606.1 NADPH:quinone oxidoreductase family protein [Acidimicrobiales bacterium]
MKGWLVLHKGTAEFVNDLPEPQLDGESMVVQVEAAAANFADRLLIDGKHQIRPARPFTAGLEVAGTVVDSSSERHPVGSRVMGLVEPGVGSWAERCRCSPRNVIRIPDGVDAVTALAIHLNAETVWLGLHHRARIAAGDVVLVHAAAGGIGTMAVQLAVAAGANVFATCSAGKAEVPFRLGATAVVDNRAANWHRQIAAYAPGGVDIVVDPVGGDLFERSLKLLRFEGRLITLGFASGAVPSMPANYALVKNLSLIGVFWEPYAAHHPELVERAAREIFALHAEGRIDPCVTVVDDISNAVDRVNDVAAGATVGKTVLVWQ